MRKWAHGASTGNQTKTKILPAGEVVIPIPQRDAFVKEHLLRTTSGTFKEVGVISIKNSYASTCKEMAEAITFDPARVTNDKSYAFGEGRFINTRERESGRATNASVSSNEN